MLKSTTLWGYLRLFHEMIKPMTAEQKENRKLWFWLVITFLLAVLPWFLPL